MLSFIFDDVILASLSDSHDPHEIPVDQRLAASYLADAALCAGGYGSLGSPCVWQVRRRQKGGREGCFVLGAGNKRVSVVLSLVG